jgi:hypothetical protein
MNSPEKILVRIVKQVVGELLGDTASHGKARFIQD